MLKTSGQGGRLLSDKTAPTGLESRLDLEAPFPSERASELRASELISCLNPQITDVGDHTIGEAWRARQDLGGSVEIGEVITRQQQDSARLFECQRFDVVVAGHVPQEPAGSV